MKVSGFALGLAAVAATLFVNGGAFAGDAANGEKVFKKFCTSCHTTDEGKNRVGPSLHAVVGRAAGSISSFSYSTANKGSGLTWTEEVLEKYLADPKGVVPGTKMVFAGVKDATERADLIEFLKTK